MCQLLTCWKFLYFKLKIFLICFNQALPNLHMKLKVDSVAFYFKFWDFIFCMISRILLRLKRYGISGVLAYGLLNTAYYLSTFLFVWWVDWANWNCEQPTGLFSFFISLCLFFLNVSNRIFFWKSWGTSWYHHYRRNLVVHEIEAQFW